jgi:hypothetical protein
MSDEISVQFTRFFAFYWPLSATVAGGIHTGMVISRTKSRRSVRPRPGRSGAST